MRILLHKFSIAITVSMLLVACGGGGDEGPVTPPTGTNPNPPVVVNPPTKAEASRFLQQASFGATLESMDVVVERGIEGWINWQQGLPVNTHSSYFIQNPFTDDNDYAQHINAWWYQSLLAEDQLRQRVAFALSQIWVINFRDIFTEGDPSAYTHYYDILLNNAFGNYRELMEEVTLNPLMGEYLSMLRNEKPNIEKNIRPDENYARELMQLFTIGLVELENNGELKLDGQNMPIPTYDQEVIKGFAHVFTGWTWSNSETFKRRAENRDFKSSMRAFPDYHDNGSKQVLSGVVIPAGQTPEQDLDDALDNIFNHPNVGPFVAKSLIQKLVTSNPSPEYIERVANTFNNNGQGIRGDMRAVVKSILMDAEAQTGQTSAGNVFGKVKEPLLRLTALWRAFDAQAANGIYDFRWVYNDFFQAPLSSPSVFNFFSPFYSPQGNFKNQDLVAPEMQIHSEGTMAKMTNQLYWRAYAMNNLIETDPSSEDILININRERDLVANPQDLIDHLNLLLMANQMSDHMATTTLSLIDTINADRPDQRAADAIALVITSPEFSIQR